MFQTTDRTKYLLKNWKIIKTYQKQPNYNKFIEYEVQTQWLESWITTKQNNKQDQKNQTHDSRALFLRSQNIQRQKIE